MESDFIILFPGVQYVVINEMIGHTKKVVKVLKWPFLAASGQIGWAGKKTLTPIPITGILSERIDMQFDEIGGAVPGCTA